MRRYLPVQISLALLLATLLACGGASRGATDNSPRREPGAVAVQPAVTQGPATGRSTPLPPPATFTPVPAPDTATPAPPVEPAEPPAPPAQPAATTPPQPTPTPKPAAFSVNTPVPTSPPVAENLPTDYDAGQAVRQYAGAALGIEVEVLAAGGREGQVTLPPSAQAEVDAAVRLAGVTYAALLREGAASVSLGAGSISGDLSADIQDASLGAFSLLRDGRLPANPDEALNLVRSTFPGVSHLTFTRQEASAGAGPLAGGGAQGYVFSAHTEQSEVDVKSGQAKVVAVGALAGVTPAGVNRVNVFVVLGKGALAGSIQ